ncbi:MAG: PEP-CTERM sorting domain-containing protein [Candidatus Nealsonbacteria bacterium]|nr:PEP-CTERM sorting domain-containing protein [Candidatus Nealsonbacteria bacterium]
MSDSARYSGISFTPPTGDLTSDANTQLLYNFNDPPGSTTVLDESPFGRTGTLGVGFGGATSPTLVPEPFTLILLTIGAVGLLAYGWRRRK